MPGGHPGVCTAHTDEVNHGCAGTCVGHSTQVPEFLQRRLYIVLNLRDCDVDEIIDDLSINM